ncbi:hypothetical protein [Acinetobacter modestus]|uniref:hypothetical protein n=1 Tax=Acinetobacter modestus TaxID=1776740 RepID=UPI00320A4F25
MEQDEHRLYEYFRYEKDGPNPDGNGTYEGHQNHYRGVQKQLRLVMSFADARQCKYDKEEAVFWAYTPPHLKLRFMHSKGIE